MEDIQSALLTAAGVSDTKEAIAGLIKRFLEPAGAAFVEELVYRFLLTRGDTLGGSMRNLGGVLAQQKFTRSVIAHLKNAGKSYQWLHAGTGKWAEAPDDETGIEVHLRGLAWKGCLATAMALLLVLAHGWLSLGRSAPTAVPQCRC
jgi:hypothetical protein